MSPYDQDRAAEAEQWEADHPGGVVSDDEWRAMERYAYDSCVEEGCLDTALAYRDARRSTGRAEEYGTMSERALVYGSRTWIDRAAIQEFVDSLPDGSVVIHGGADGADSLAGMAAAKRGLQVEVYRAKWFEYGKAAGPIRNQQMIDDGKPTVARGYRRGFHSPGTDDMTRRLERADIPHEVVMEART